jgi:hypothetical protein
MLKIRLYGGISCVILVFVVFHLVGFLHEILVLNLGTVCTLSAATLTNKLWLKTLN